MKLPPKHFLTLKNTAFALKSATALVFGMGVAADAAVLTWTGGGGVGRTAWGQKQNWSGATLATLDTLQFGGTAELANNNDRTAFTYNGLVFLNGAGAFTLSGNAFTLATNASGSGITNNSANIQTVNLPITLSGAQTFNANTNALVLGGTIANGGNLLTLTGANAITMTGVVSGTGGLTKLLGGTTTISGANSYTGVTTVSAGTLRATTSANALGAGASTLTLSGGILELANNTALAFNRNTTVSANAQINSERLTAGAGVTHSLGTLSIGAQTLTIGTDASVNSGTAGVTFGATTLSATGLTFTANLGTLLTLGAVTGTNTGFTVNGEGNTTLSGIVGTGTGGLTKAGGGILTLSATNTRTGITTINGGTLSVGTIGDGGNSSNLGAASSAATNLVLGGGALRYTGATASTDRAFTLSTGTTGTIDVSTGGTTLTISGASAATTGALTKAGAGTLALTGANGHTGVTTISAGTLQMGNAGTTGSLSASGAITNNSALSFNRTNTVTQGTDFGSISGTGTVTQAGSGTLILGSANSYSGSTAVSAGVLRVSNATGLGTTAAGTTVSSGAALELSGGITIGAETLSLSGSGIASGGALRSVSGNNTYGGAITASANSLIMADTGVLTLNGAVNSTFDTTFGGAGDVVAAGGISGAGSVIKNGAGVLTLSAGSSQANTRVNQGQLNVNHLAALGTPAGTLTMAAGTVLDNTSGAAVSVTNPKSISLGSSLSFLGSNNLNLGTGTVTLSGNTEINVAANELGFAGEVIGAGFGITKTGAGKLRLTGLTGSGSFTGNSFVNAGTLTIGGASTFGGTAATVVTVADGAFLEIAGTASLGNVTLVSRPEGLISSSLTNASQSFSSNGALNPSNANFDGVVTIQSGVAIQVSANYLGATPATPQAGRIVLDDNSTLNATAGFTINANQGIELAGGTANFEVNPNQALIVESSVAGAGGIVKLGSGNVRLTGVNTYTGGTVVSAGILGISNGDALGAVSGRLKLDGGTLVGAQVVSGTPISAVTIAAERSLVLANGKISGMDAQTGLSLRYDGVIAEESGAGAASGLRIGSSAARTGTVILGGNNTYQGATTVDFGKLIVNGSTSAASAVGVSSGASLAGSGTVGGNTTIASGGALAPGNSPGVLTVSGTTSFESGSMFEWEIDTAQSNPTTNRGIAYDGVNTTAITGSGAIFKIMLTGAQDFTDDFWNQDRTWTDIFKSADGSTTLSDWASVFSGGFQYSYNGQTVAPTSQGFFTTTGSSLTWSVVPEPSNVLAGMLAASALLRRRRSA